MHRQRTHVPKQISSTPSMFVGQAVYWWSLDSSALVDVSSMAFWLRHQRFASTYCTSTTFQTQSLTQRPQQLTNKSPLFSIHNDETSAREIIAVVESSFLWSLHLSYLPLQLLLQRLKCKINYLIYYSRSSVKRKIVILIGKYLSNQILYICWANTRLSLEQRRIVVHVILTGHYHRK